MNLKEVVLYKRKEKGEWSERKKELSTKEERKREREE